MKLEDMNNSDLLREIIKTLRKIEKEIKRKNTE